MRSAGEMQSNGGSARPCSLEVTTEVLPFHRPFVISGYSFSETQIILVTLRDGEAFGRGEAAGVYFMGEDPESMVREVEEARGAIEAGVSRQALREIMPPGGARNAVDCALWELEARRVGMSVWELAGLKEPRPLVTTFTLGAEEPDAMVHRARDFVGARAFKLKLAGEDVAQDGERVRRMRDAFPEAWIGVDANQGFTTATLRQLMPILVEARVELLEQPLRRGAEAEMRGLDSPVRTAADESALNLGELDAAAGLFDVVNIKLDKCGGLTEALMIAERARELGMGVMVGNMTGSSWAMAPAFVLGQLCDVADLDGVTFLAEDRPGGIRYEDGLIHCPDSVWGGLNSGSHS